MLNNVHLKKIQRLPQSHTWGIFIWDTAYYIVIQWSIKVILHWNMRYPVWKCVMPGTAPDLWGAMYPPKSAKGSLLATKWAENGVFVGGLRGWGSKSPPFGSKRSTFLGFHTTPKLILATGLDCTIYMSFRIFFTYFFHLAGSVH